MRQDRRHPAAAGAVAETGRAPAARVLALQRMAGNRAVRGLLARAPAVSSAGQVALQRTIDPDYATWRGPRADSRLLLVEFLNNYVVPEVQRLAKLGTGGDLDLWNQVKADYRTTDAAMAANPFNLVAAVNAVNALVANANAMSADRDVRVGPANQLADAEDRARRERTRRENSMTRIGTTRPGPVRGLQSAREGGQLLDRLHTDLTAGMQNSPLVLGQVGIRGSSVTGIRSRSQQPFESATAAHQVMSDASDHDFFFTCTGLDHLIDAHADDRNTINENGTMMAVYLLRFLQRLSGLTDRHGAPLYPWAAGLRTHLTNFTTWAEGITGRKSDVTYISPTGTTGAGLAADASTVIR